ncbi:MAG: hypothetical protein UT24_C0008G0042 [Candidatus Woesebacteria bacterium GW2011_GWB1_39_12]|uniref:Uncharacterized protein n=2 Tax=Candidatus Woeseibacteriota TaxID=1752722 RepID=A0A0G0LZT8_9BACT|nr:MAG: hypothetical protein UT23_C0012G0058 [Candidatus Woesebacteria bacterium GW2011_GWA1_39_12]KKR00914.1 MAG: hypothetical protein UT24_C0008G0042 [Candidatus Woesebacteria bacterium GW2011_GWB1_39_12]
MQTLLLIAAVCILAVGIFVGQKTKIELGNQQGKVLSDDSNKNPSGKVSVEANITTPTLVPTLVPTPRTSPLESYKYPNSVVVGDSEKTLTLQSQDSSNTVTDWYKNKIINEGMNVKTFVKTSANSNILNKLTGAREGEEVNVEISKEPSESIVHITVEVKEIE